MRTHIAQYKYILLLLTGLLLSQTARAQVGETRNDFSVGVNGGCVFNRMSFNPTIRQKFKPGMSIGFSARYICERYMKMLCGVQMEVNYTEMGWKEAQENTPDQYERKVNYLQIPLLANLGFGREVKGVKGYLLLGPQIGIYLSDKAKKNEWVDEQNPIRPNNVIQQYSLPIQRKFEYGITGGLGIEISSKIGHIMLDGRYYYGLSDIFNNGKSDPFGRSANGAIVVRATYLFDIIKTKGVKRK